MIQEIQETTARAGALSRIQIGYVKQIRNMESGRSLCYPFRFVRLNT